MPSKYNHYSALNEIQNIISDGSFDPENIGDRSRVAYLFVLIRKLIDSLISKEERIKYRLLNFYCTWIIHIDMDRHLECIFKIKEIEQLIHQNKDDPNLRELLTQALSLESIPRQINELIIGCGITKTETITNESWWQIKPILLNLISTAPLLNNSKEEYLKEISVIALPGVNFGLYDLPLDKPVYGFKLITTDCLPGVFIGVAIVFQIIRKGRCTFGIKLNMNATNLNTCMECN